MKNASLLTVLMAASLAAGCAPMAPAPPPASLPAPAAGPVDDASLAARVQAALADDAALRPYRIEALVKDGVVTLSGDVKSLALHRHAAALVLGIPGVRAVDNQLVITG